jgi:hypothetical protein
MLKHIISHLIPEIDRGAIGLPYVFHRYVTVEVMI